MGFWGEESGERAGARTQDQRLKRAMLYQLSYPLALFSMVAERVKVGSGTKVDAESHVPTVFSMGLLPLH